MRLGVGVGGIDCELEREGARGSTSEPGRGLRMGW